MNIINTIESNKVTIQYELTDIEVEVLTFLNDNRYIEFRTSFDSSEELKSSNSKFKRSELSDLITHGFIDYNFNAWHTEFNLAKLGEEFVKQFTK